MQSSPYHSNKLFDNRFSMMNVPKSSSECPWKLVKDVDPVTGSFVYKLVNSEHDTSANKAPKESASTKVVAKAPEKTEGLPSTTGNPTGAPTENLKEPAQTNSVQPLTKENVEKLQEGTTAPIENTSTAVKPNEGLFLETLNGETKVVKKESDTRNKIVFFHNSKKSEGNGVEVKEQLPAKDSTVAVNGESVVEDKTKVVSEILPRQYPPQDLLFENFASFELDYSNIRSKTKNYVLTHFPPYVQPCYAKDVQTISRNSRIIDFRKDHLVKVSQAIIMIYGESVYLRENLELSLSFKFIRSSGLKHKVYEYTTSRIKLKNNDGNFSERVLTNIDSYLPLSDQNIFTYIPVLQVHREGAKEGEFDLTVKVVLRTSQVHVDTIDNVEELPFLPKDTVFLEK